MRKKLIKKSKQKMFQTLFIIIILLVFIMVLRNENNVEAYGSGQASEVQLLARAINGEARGEPYEGQVAVGAVIINRSKHSSFPNSISGVIYQPRSIYRGIRWPN